MSENPIIRILFVWPPVLWRNEYSMKLEELSGVELGSEVKSGNITPTEVVDYFADRIEKRNPGLNAFVYNAAFSRDS